MKKVTLNERIKGCLTGAVIGSELSFTRHSKPELFEKIRKPKDWFSIKLEPDFKWRPELNNQCAAKFTSLIGLGLNSYVKTGGRAAPEDFAALFKDDDGVSAPAFMFDGMHTVQEILKEGER